MLVCLACPKQATLHSSAVDDHDFDSNNNPVDANDGSSCRSSGHSPTKIEHIKSLTTQLKDIVMRFSIGAYKHCRPCSNKEATMAASGAIDQKAAAGGHKYNKEELNLLEIENERISMLAGMRNSRRSTGSVDDEVYDRENRADQRLLEAMQEELGLEFAELDERATESAELCFGSEHHQHREAIFPVPSNPGRCHRHRLKKNRSCSRKRSSMSSTAVPEVKKAQCRNYDDEDEEEDDKSDEQGLLTTNKHRMELENENENNVELDEINAMRSSDEGEEAAEEEEEEMRDKEESKLGRGKDYEEWVAQVEAGVMISFVALPNGCNFLKRIRFSRELFSKRQAQQWWAENSDMVHELYSVTKVEAPSCDSPRSSCVSTTSCSSCCSSQRNMLRNTLVVPSPREVGSNTCEANLEMQNKDLSRHDQSFNTLTLPQLKEDGEILVDEFDKSQKKEKGKEQQHEHLCNSLNNHIHEDYLHNTIDDHVSNNTNEDRELKRVRVLLC